MITAPCEWPLATSDDDASCKCSPLEALAPAERTRFERMAVELLWAWTGRKYGLCEVTVRPCRAECASRYSTFWGPHSGDLAYQRGVAGWLPMLFAGEWWNVGCGACGLSCQCGPDQARSIVLPGVASQIVSIWIGGEELPDTAYTLRDGVLYRTDGGVWPYCNDDIADPHTADSPAWEVTYKRGITVPMGGQIAAYHLACELAKAACNDESCGLPSNVRSVTRQGVSIDLITTEFNEVKEGRTGIWIIDSWVASVHAPQAAPSRVFSPDIEPGRGKGMMSGLGYGRTRTW